MDAHVLKAEETACTPTARLNIVDDQQRAMRFRNGGDAAQPLRRRGVQTAFALHRFDQYGGRRIQTAGWIGKALFEQRRRIDIRPIIAVIGLMRDMVQRYRSEEHTSELQSLMRISYAVLCLHTQKV